ncbi:MAG: hypothetical protein AB1585_20330 [Thermodesulfobacteriota bacterium]
MLRKTFFLLIVTLVSGGTCPASAQGVDEVQIALDSPYIPLLAVGKWMIAPDKLPARWLEEKYFGKSLREPINIIIIDRQTSEKAEAKKKLYEACKIAGFPARMGHSSGYSAYIAGSLYSQLPSEHNHAFSDEPFEVNNNHGRIFGPHRTAGKAVFTAAFSWEEIDPLQKVKHGYNSFNRARDRFAWAMDRQTCFKVKKFINLENAILGNPIITTGDHDGTAVLLVCE